MYIRQHFRTVEGKRKAYWALVESFRTERGPKQRVVTWLGALDESGRVGVLQAAKEQSGSTKEPGHLRQLSLFEYEDQEAEPLWVRVNAKAVRVENSKQFGGPWLALKLIEKLKLDEFFTSTNQLAANKCRGH